MTTKKKLPSNKGKRKSDSRKHSSSDVDQSSLRSSLRKSKTKDDKVSVQDRDLTRKPSSSSARRKSMGDEPDPTYRDTALRGDLEKDSSLPEQSLEQSTVTASTTIDDLITNSVMPSLSGTYQSNLPPNLADWSTLDPFDQFSHAPDSPLKDYDFDALPADKVADFLHQINMVPGNSASDNSVSVKDMSTLNVPQNDALIPALLSNGIPPVQHSVWVGNPLNAASSKQKAFMDALVENKQKNPKWSVVLWTDQSRNTLNTATPDSPEGKMRQWAADNKIVLASIDEVFAGNNKMELNNMYKLEQLKGGTGRAAASDIVRLEVLNRFGGMYVDGDKKIKVRLDEITETAAKNEMRIAVPQDLATGETVEPETDAEKEAVKQNMSIVKVQGFAAGNQTGAHQNCALCSTKGNLAIKGIMARIQKDYRKDRQQLGNFDKKFRAQRMEVIERTGPSAVRDTVDPGKKGVGLMPPDSVNTYTGTTSWTGEREFTGGEGATAFTKKVNDLPIPSALYKQAKTAAPLPPKLPDISALAPDRVNKIATVVKRGLTVLSYTIPNEMGRLDLNYLKPHLDGLTRDEQQLAVHATLQSLSQLAGLAGSVKTLRLPSLREPKPDDLALAGETLDLIMSSALPNLKLSDFTIQDAALEGNLTFLRYAKDKGLLDDLNKPAVQWIDGGIHNNLLTGGKIDVVQAAIIGGNRAAIQYLAALDSFALYAKLDDALKEAAKFGQIDTVIALAEMYERPDSIKLLVSQPKFGHMGVEILERYRSTFGNNPIIKTASVGIVESAVLANALDIIPRLRELGVDIKHFSKEDRKKIIQAMVSRALDYQTCLDMLDAATQLGVDENELLIKAGELENPALITNQLNKKRPDAEQIREGYPDPEAELAIARFKFPKAKASKNDYKNVVVKFPNVEDTKDMSLTSKDDYKDVVVNDLKPDDALNLARKALLYAYDPARESEEGKEARVNGWKGLLEDIKTRKQLENNLLSDLIDLTQQQFAKDVFDNNLKPQMSSTSKNDYKDVVVNDLEPEDAQKLVQKALVYAYDPVRASEVGKEERVKGWSDLLEALKTQKQLDLTKPLLDLIDLTQQQFTENLFVNNLEPEDAQKLVQKALLYAYDPARASEKGKEARVNGWNDLLEAMKTQKKLAQNERLLALIDLTQKQLTKEPVEPQKQQTAETPNLNQSQVKRIVGKIRRTFKPPIFVPGKGMQKM